MIPCLNAPRPALSWASPFSRGQDERPIKLTFHDSTLVGLPDEELAALEALESNCTNAIEHGWLRHGIMTTQKQLNAQ